MLKYSRHQYDTLLQFDEEGVRCHVLSTDTSTTAVHVANKVLGGRGGLSSVGTDLSWMACCHACEDSGVYGVHIAMWGS